VHVSREPLEDHSRCAKGRSIARAENRNSKTPGMVGSFAERVTLEMVTGGESAETPRPAPCGEAIVGFKSLPISQQGFELRANISPTGVVVKLVLPVLVKAASETTSLEGPRWQLLVSGRLPPVTRTSGNPWPSWHLEGSWRYAPGLMAGVASHYLADVCGRFLRFVPARWAR
jgi:hypothetical protein